MLKTRAIACSVVLFATIAAWLPACGLDTSAGVGSSARDEDTTDTAQAADLATEAEASVCVPDCAEELPGLGQACGDDGCGGDCGTCATSDVCAEGRCCVPDCSGHDCGDDGCGRSCGACSAGLTCSFQYSCVEDPCAGVDALGCCDGDTVVFCQGGALQRQYCFQDAKGTSCGWSATTSTYDCAASPGSDPSGAAPRDCAALCLPACEDKSCGEDGCGGSCGTCGAQSVCADGVCGPCTADCEGRECGSDGCGSSCGACPEGDACDDGLCSCDPQCHTPQGIKKQCGADGCGGNCGLCEEGLSCSENGACVCTPDCESDTGETMTCGDDGCGGLCGFCLDGCACEGGQCAADQGAWPKGCDGTVTDPTSGRMWRYDFGGSMDYDDAKTLCADMTTAGFDDWRLPNIDELRSLIVGCAATASGGTCPVTASCSDGSCLTDACKGCGLSAGPGPGGVYLDAAFEAAVETHFWSGTQLNLSEAPAFVVEFDSGAVGLYVTTAEVSYKGVRCVR